MAASMWASAYEAVSDMTTSLRTSFAAEAGDAAQGAAPRSQLAAAPQRPPTHRLRAVVRPLLSPPFLGLCEETRRIMVAILARREHFAECMGEWLFGSSPYARLRQRRRCGSDCLEAAVVGGEAPAARAELCARCRWGDADASATYGDLWSEALHWQPQHETSEFLSESVLGCGPSLPALALDAASRCVAVFGWLASGAVRPAALGAALQRLFPSVADIAAKFVVLDNIEVDIDGAEGGGHDVTVITLDAPLDLDRLAVDYERIAAGLRHFEEACLTLRHPQTGDVLLTGQLKDGHVQLEFGMHDGDLVWASGEPLAWADDGRFAVDAELDSRIRLLGLSFAAMSLPQLLFQVECKPGAVSITCARAGAPDEECRTEEGSYLPDLESVAWSAFTNAAWLVFDVPRFQRLLEKRFRWEVHFRPSSACCAARAAAGAAPAGEGGAWVLCFLARLAVPTSRVFDAFTEYFRGFVTSQFHKLHGVSLWADLLEAVIRDANAILADDGLARDENVKAEEAEHLGSRFL